MRQFYTLGDIAAAAALYDNPVVCFVDDWVFDDNETYYEWCDRITVIHSVVIVCEREDAVVLSLKYGAIVRSVEVAIERFGLRSFNVQRVLDSLPRRGV